jgi:hypothetical protein
MERSEIFSRVNDVMRDIFDKYEPAARDWQVT